MRHLALILAYILLPGLAPAAEEVTVTVSSFPPGSKLGPGAAAIIRADMPDDREVVWRWNPEPAEGELWDAGKLLGGRENVLWWFGSATPGRRTITLQIAAPGLDPFVECAFDYGAPGPGPGPGPTPGDLWGAVVVYETEGRSDKIEALLDHAEALLASHDKKLVGLDKDKTDEKGRPLPWCEKAQGQTLPHVFLIDKRGRILDEEPWPETTDEMEELLEPYLGTAVPAPVFDDLLREIQPERVPGKACPIDRCPTG